MQIGVRFPLFEQELDLPTQPVRVADLLGAEGFTVEVGDQKSRDAVTLLKRVLAVVARASLGITRQLRTAVRSARDAGGSLVLLNLALRRHRNNAPGQDRLVASTAVVRPVRGHLTDRCSTTNDGKRVCVCSVSSPSSPCLT